MRGTFLVSNLFSPIWNPSSKKRLFVIVVSLKGVANETTERSPPVDVWKLAELCQSEKGRPREVEVVVCAVRPTPSIVLVFTLRRKKIINRSFSTLPFHIRPEISLQLIFSQWRKVVVEKDKRATEHANHARKKLVRLSSISTRLQSLTSPPMPPFILISHFSCHILVCSFPLYFVSFPINRCSLSGDNMWNVKTNGGQAKFSNSNAYKSRRPWPWSEICFTSQFLSDLFFSSTENILLSRWRTFAEQKRRNRLSVKHYEVLIVGWAFQGWRLALKQAQDKRLRDKETNLARLRYRFEMWRSFTAKRKLMVRFLSISSECDLFQSLILSPWQTHHLPSDLSLGFPFLPFLSLSLSETCTFDDGT